MKRLTEISLNAYSDEANERSISARMENRLKSFRWESELRKIGLGLYRKTGQRIVDIFYSCTK